MHPVFTLSMPPTNNYGMFATQILQVDAISEEFLSLLTKLGEIQSKCRQLLRFHHKTALMELVGTTPLSSSIDLPINSCAHPRLCAFAQPHTRFVQPRSVQKHSILQSHVSVRPLKTRKRAHPSPPPSDLCFLSFPFLPSPRPCLPPSHRAREKGRKRKN